MGGPACSRGGTARRIGVNAISQPLQPLEASGLLSLVRKMRTFRIRVRRDMKRWHEPFLMAIH